MNTGSIFSSSKLRSVRESFEPVLRAMRGGALSVTPGVQANVPVGPQLIETFVITLVFSVVMQLIESNFAQLKRYQDMAVEMYPMTYDSPQTFVQDPNSGFPLLKPSQDERNGAEYSFSMFLSVQPDNFTGEKGYKHVFHKGSAAVFPLLAPGVFFRADTNTLRVYQNSNLAWDNHVDIPNIPLKKWFHLVVMVKGRALDVYINGNLAARNKFLDIPKLNFGAFYLFFPKLINTSSVTADKCNPLVKVANTALAVATSALATAVTGEKSGPIIGTGGVLGEINSGTYNNTTEKDRDVRGVPIAITGRMNGFASRIKYFAFALSYAQIDKLLREGPNPNLFKPSGQAPLSASPVVTLGWDVTANTGPTYVPNANAMDKNLPGYQTDSWWTSGQ